jgi:hypothetical protein
MKKEKHLNPSQKSSWLERLIFMVVLAVLVLRGTYSESPGTDTIDPAQVLTNEGFSLIISMVLLVCVSLWLVSSLLRKPYRWRKTGLLIGLELLVIGMFLSGKAASNIRAAVSESFILIVPVIVAVMMIQLIRNRVQIRLVLLVIVTLGLCNAYQCFDQFSSGNQMMVEQYEQNPDGQLERLNIEKGSFEHFLYEHRL